MSFVQFSKVSVAFGDRDILKDVSLNLAKGSKAALAGANGCGKTTLMKVLSGSIQPDSGDRAIQKGCRVAYLPQSGIVHTELSLEQEVQKAFYRGYELQHHIETIGDQLSVINPEDPRAMRLAEDLHEFQEALDNSGWYRREALIEQILVGLGFATTDFNRSVDEFSGGWQMRIALAKVLLETPDILLLDEPTNYLDLEARTWLEQWLQSFTGGYLIVSHDRYFLDTTVNEVYELFSGSLKRYAGTYTQYEKVRAVELESLIKRYEEQQDEIEKTNEFIRKFRVNASKAALVQDRIKRLEKMELIEIPENLKKMKFHFPQAPHTGRLIFTLTQLSKTWGDRPIIKDLDLVVEKQERLVVVGRNGAGKSTLLRILAGQDPDYTGSIEAGAGVQIGYFSQDISETLVGKERIIDLLESEAPIELIPRLRDMLAAFLFRGDDVYKQIDVLSGGEKSRLALLRLLFKPLNVLLLDEPTNHLDIHSKDVLLDALRSFDGTIIFVSHDRAFIEGLANRVLEITASSDGSASKLRNFPGSYSYYLERIEREQNGTQKKFASFEHNNLQKSEHEKNIGINNPKQDAKIQANLAWQEQKKITAERRKLEREEARLVDELTQLDQELKEAEALLAKPEIYSDIEKSRKAQTTIESIHTKIETITSSWERVTEELEVFL